VREYERVVKEIGRGRGGAAVRGGATVDEEKIIAKFASLASVSTSRVEEGFKEKQGIIFECAYVCVRSF
jgi:hypothetical protein